VWVVLFRHAAEMEEVTFFVYYKETCKPFFRKLLLRIVYNLYSAVAKRLDLRSISSRTLATEVRARLCLCVSVRARARVCMYVRHTQYFQNVYGIVNVEEMAVMM
jgi:hypothetical protein